ncbi:MAG TPA: enolase C-terminal domain-like protein [candidate division Zixibacteria bacterium]|nr:enolase C-terminal domain-like protein [candidate division Zixibacteria bacterium]
MQVDSVRVDLPLKKRFATAAGAADVKSNYLTLLNNRYSGEAAPSVAYGPTDEELREDLEKGMDYIRGLDKVEIGTLEAIDHLPINPLARSALMGMTLNYLSGESRRYAWELLGLSTPLGIKSSFTISVDKSSDMIDAIRATDYPIVKIKMGHEEDVLLLDALEQVKGKEIRVDANGGWSCAKAEEMLYHLGRIGVRIIEQPTKIEFVDEWQHLKGKDSEVLLLADEGLNTINDYERIKSGIDGINIKLEKSGGILEGMRLANRARQDNKKVMLGCMVESSVGIAQAVYMSSLADYFDLDGPLLLEHDIARGIRYDRESIEVDREIIGGPKLKRDVLQKYIKV